MVLSGCKQVSGDQGIDWGRTLLLPGVAELPKPPSGRRQPPLHQQAEALKCPRCGSTNTKFCYYNNYNKTQPRHLCKSCKRHWTEGGTLRNVPVGGGRKNKRPKISKPATTATTTATAATTTAPRQQELARFPLISANSGDLNQKSMSNILYQALIRSSSPTKGIDTAVIPEKSFMADNHGGNTMNSTGLNVSAGPQINPTADFHFSSINTFDMNASLNPLTCYQSLSTFDNYAAANLDSMEESTITTVNIPSSSGPWPGPDRSSTMDLPSYWNWNEIDVLNSADLNISWDDEVDDDNAEIKP